MRQNASVGCLAAARTTAPHHWSRTLRASREKRFELMLEIKQADGVETWTMSFGSVNAIAPDFLSAMEEALDRTLADESVAAVVLTSGLRVFSAGADAAWVGEVVRERGAA